MRTRSLLYDVNGSDVSHQLDAGRGGRTFIASTTLVSLGTHASVLSIVEYRARAAVFTEIVRARS
jgi:hypothetical protein